MARDKDKDLSLFVRTSAVNCEERQQPDGSWIRYQHRRPLPPSSIARQVAILEKAFTRPSNWSRILKILKSLRS